jgi:GPH family glycoside/pentoside/hexuronide:cation symporter
LKSKLASFHGLISEIGFPLPNVVGMSSRINENCPGGIMDYQEAVVPNQSKTLTPKTRVAFGFASLGMAVIGGVYTAMLTKFFQDNMGLDKKWIGIAMVIYAIWNAINDPIFGEITDRTKHRLGRRVPYLRYTAPFYAITFVAIWLCPEHAGQVLKFAWMLITMLAYDTCYTIVGLIHGTFLPELSESDVERGKLSIVSSLFGLLGTLLAFVIPELVRPGGTGDNVSLTPFRIAMLIVGVVCSGFIFYSSFVLKERKEFSVVDDPIPWWEAIKSTIVNKSFLVYVTTSFMCTFMFAVAMGAIFYLSDYVYQSPFGVFPLLGALFIPLAIGVPLVAIPLKHWEAAKVWRVYLLICAVGFSLVYFLPVALIPVAIAIAGFGYSGNQVVNYIVLSQVIDEDEIKTGVRREGSYLGANALVTKPAQSVAIYITALILAETAFVTTQANGGLPFLNQPESAQLGIRALVGLIPGVTLLLGAIALTWFPIKGKRLTDQQQTILEMHAQKEAKLAGMQDEHPKMELDK